jgi:SAM-dependent methyltransferase
VWPAWVCPDHLCSLVETGDALTCPIGKHQYRVVDGIPRFVAGANYADAFGLQWKRYRRTQLDSYTGTRISEDRLRRCLGPELWSSLHGKHVLECGCGAGRFTEVLLGHAAQVTSIDLSTAVEANAANFPPDDAHRVAQADITRLPFEDEQYDIVLCLGVIQHTRSPESTIAALYRHVKPGGSLVIDHYTYSLARLTKASGLFRFYFRRLSPEAGLEATERLVDLLLPLHRKSKGLQLLLGRVSPVASYYRSYPQLNEELQREWSLLDTHDSLTDWYKRLRTRSQIRRKLERLGVQNINCVRAGTGVEARGRRPPRN